MASVSRKTPEPESPAFKEDNDARAETSVSPGGSSTVDEESDDAMLPDLTLSDNSDSDTSADEGSQVEEEEEGEEEGEGKGEKGDVEEELISSREVDFLLKNAEQNRLNDLEALEDEFEDEMKDIVKERNKLLQEKMYWQTKFAGAVKSRDDLHSRHSSVSREREQLKALNAALHDEMARLQDIADVQYKAFNEFRRTLGDTVTTLSRAAEVNRTAVAEAREENNKTSRELALLRRIVLKIEEPKYDEFTFDHDFQQTLETNKSLATELETHREKLSAATTLLAEQQERIKELEKGNATLTEQLNYMESFSRRNAAKVDEAERALASSNDTLAEVQLSEQRVKGQFSNAYKKWTTNKNILQKEISDCHEKLELKDTIIRSLQQQSTAYMYNFKDTLSLVKDRTGGDDLTLKIADCLGETLDRNEFLEMELLKLGGEPYILDTGSP